MKGTEGQTPLMKRKQDKVVRKCAIAEDLIQPKRNSFRTGNVSV